MSATLRVNECRVFATTGGAEWWSLWRSRMPASRFTVLAATLGGDLVDVECESADDASWLMETAISNGVTPRALKVHKDREAIS